MSVSFNDFDLHKLSISDVTKKNNYNFELKPLLYNSEKVVIDLPPLLCTDIKNKRICFELKKVHSHLYSLFRDLDEFAITTICENSLDWYGSQFTISLVDDAFKRTLSTGKDIGKYFFYCDLELSNKKLKLNSSTFDKTTVEQSYFIPTVLLEGFKFFRNSIELKWSLLNMSYVNNKDSLLFNDLPYNNELNLSSNINKLCNVVQEKELSGEDSDNNSDNNSDRSSDENLEDNIHNNSEEDIQDNTKSNPIIKSKEKSNLKVQNSIHNHIINSFKVKKQSSKNKTSDKNNKNDSCNNILNNEKNIVSTIKQSKSSGKLLDIKKEKYMQINTKNKKNK